MRRIICICLYCLNVYYVDVHTYILYYIYSIYLLHISITRSIYIQRIYIIVLWQQYKYIH